MDELATVADGRLAGALLELLETELDKREKAIRTKIRSAINQPGKYLEPQLAVQAWLEMQAIDDLRASLTKRQRSGRSAGEREIERGRLSLQGSNIPHRSPV